MVVQWQTKRQAGFTLIEMMVVVAIIGIISAIAFPSMQRQIAQMRLKDALSFADSSFKQARTDAYVKRTNVKIKLKTVNQLIITPMVSTATSAPIEDTANARTIEFDKNITVDKVNSMPTEIAFTPNKQVLDVSTNTNLVSSNTRMGYGFCYKGDTQKYVLMIDAFANITTVQDGVCP